MKNSSILSKFLCFLLVAIPLGIYAKDKCATQIDKDFLGDCQSSGDHPPEKCIKVHPTAGGDTINTQDADCLAEGCAQECKAKGGDEILWYSKTVFTVGQYNNYICCKSKTPAQVQKTTKSCEQCKLVSDYFPPTTTPTTPTTPSTTPSTTPTTPTTPTTTSSAVPSDDTNPFLAILAKALFQ